MQIQLPVKKDDKPLYFLEWDERNLIVDGAPLGKSVSVVKATYLDNTRQWMIIGPGGALVFCREVKGSDAANFWCIQSWLTANGYVRTAESAAPEGGDPTFQYHKKYWGRKMPTSPREMLEDYRELLVCADISANGK